MVKNKAIINRTVFIILVSIVSFLMFAVLELNKNTLISYLILSGINALFVIAYTKILKDKKRYLKVIACVLWALFFVIVFIVTWPPYANVKAYSGKVPDYTETISINDGEIKGVYNEDKSVEIFAGIPYAAPPVGEYRWKAPVDPSKWDDVKVCDQFMPMSMQPTNMPIYDSLVRIIGFSDYKISLDDNYIPPVSEDSLYLNIWKPSGEKENLPVLVYIHGGSLKTGQTWYEDYSGENLAKEDVIVVNFAYRLGVFGYLATDELVNEDENGSSGNYGMLDQIKALEWVRDNIEYFGGDKNNITLAGESAGSACVSALCVSPLAKGLFKNAVMESSTVAGTIPPHSFRLFDEALESGKKLMKKYKCENIEELRSLSANTIVGEAESQHHMTVDGYFLEDTPYNLYKKGEFNEENVMHGYNLEESASFIMFIPINLSNYDSSIRGFFGGYEEAAEKILTLYDPKTNKEAHNYWAEIFGAALFDYSHYCLNRLEVENNVDTYQYFFTKENGRLGPWHSGEEIYLYRNVPEKSPLFNDRDRELCDQMSTYYLNFIKTGNPNGDGLPKWEINTDSISLMEFGEKTEMVSERKQALYDIFDEMYGWGETKK